MAKESYRMVMSKAKRESAHGEELQVKYDHISAPTSMREAECKGGNTPSGSEQKVSRAWRKATLKDLVAYYHGDSKGEHQGA